MLVSRRNGCPPELTQWITPAILILGFLYLNRSIRNTRGELRQDMNQMESRFESRMDRMETQIGDLRQQVEIQIGELRERMAHLEGLLEGLREAITRRNVA